MKTSGCRQGWDVGLRFVGCRRGFGAGAARALLADAAAGKLDPGAAAAVIEAAGLPRPQRSWPCELTGREVEVLRLCARA